jgi:ABC-2 type transport system permease protein
MSAITATPRGYTWGDTVTMLRRDLLHALRYPAVTISTIAVPVIMMLLFVFVFGGAIGAGGGNGGLEYINYVVPGILMMTVGSGTLSTAVNISTDMQQGIINRFKTMAISRTSVLTGHLVGALIRTAITLVLVLGVALLAGFRPDAGLTDWLLTAAFLALMIVGISWMAIGLGLGATKPEGANVATQPLQFGPFVSSAFVDPDTMPSGIRWFAEYQPFTPIIDTLRGLLLGTEIGSSAMQAVGWLVLFSVVGFFRARAVYNRDPAR